MNPFTQVNLSPLAHEPFPVPLPFDLTWADLRPLLPDFDWMAHATAQALERHTIQGLHGQGKSTILTLDYPARPDTRSTRTFFFKRDLARKESARYRCLKSCGVPTPKIAGVIQKEAAEVLVLEFLPVIGIEFSSRSEVDSLLHLVAEVNAMKDSPDLFLPPPSPLQAGNFGLRVVEALDRLACERPVYSILPDRWMAAYEKSLVAAGRMPLALNHNEFSYQQVGWTEGSRTRRLVIFDLESMVITQRFTDIANIVYSLALYTGRDEYELFCVYLDHLGRLTGANLDPHQAFVELRWLRIKIMFESLPWLAGTLDHPDDLTLTTALALTMDSLRADLAAIDLR